MDRSRTQIPELEPEEYNNQTLRRYVRGFAGNEDFYVSQDPQTGIQQFRGNGSGRYMSGFSGDENFYVSHDPQIASRGRETSIQPHRASGLGNILDLSREIDHALTRFNDEVKDLNNLLIEKFVNDAITAADDVNLVFFDLYTAFSTWQKIKYPQTLIPTRDEAIIAFSELLGAPNKLGYWDNLAIRADYLTRNKNIIPPTRRLDI